VHQPLARRSARCEEEFDADDDVRDRRASARRRNRGSRRSSTFDLSRYMGTSLEMIDRTYGHLARDAKDHAIALLDEFDAREAAGRNAAES
jgi:hypothetical protein